MINAEKPYDDICDFAETLATKAPLMHQPSEITLILLVWMFLAV